MDLALHDLLLEILDNLAEDKDRLTRPERYAVEAAADRLREVGLGEG